MKRFIVWVYVLINSIMILGDVLYHILFFKTYTYYSRWFEIACGILMWLYLIEMVYIAQ